jgi:hypothetical protein
LKLPFDAGRYTKSNPLPGVAALLVASSLMVDSEAAVESLATFLKMGGGSVLDIRAATKDPNVKR